MAARSVKHWTKAVVAAALISAGPAAGEATSPLGAGLYETSLTVTIADERQLPETDEQCFTKDDLEHPEKWLATSLGEECVPTNLTQSVPVTTFEIACAGDGEQIATRGQLTTGEDNFEAVITMTEDIGGEKLESVFAISARRTAECPDVIAE
jgi:hypothetical protein